MKVVLIGKSGMLGSCFLKMLSSDEDFEMYAFGHEDLDVTDQASVSEVFQKISPDFVINCAAYTAVDDAETNKELAFMVNSEAVKSLSNACKRENAVLLHFSTDYVFNGEIMGFVEDDKPDALNIYGESKLAGEKAIINSGVDHYIIRTSWLFGDGGNNFVNTMLSLGEKHKILKIVSDQIGSPTYTHDLCMAVIEYFLHPFLTDVKREHEHLINDSFDIHEKLEFGVYHLTNSGNVSWSNFAREIFMVKGMDIEVLDISSEEFGRPAKRPPNSVLLSTKADFRMRSWKDALMAYLK